MNNSLNELIVEELQGLSRPQQAQVLEFVQSLKSNGIKGTPGRNLRRFVGTIPKEDLEVMRDVIEEECERINEDDW